MAQGFKIEFTEGKTYDLETIFNKADRLDSSSALNVEVKVTDDIAKLVFSKISDDINTSLNDPAISETIHKLMYEEYLISDGKIRNQEIITNNIIKYLRNVLKEYMRLSFDMTFGENILTITWSFDNEDLKAEIKNYYAKYKNEFDKLLYDVPVGGLAVADKIIKKNKVIKEDYIKYLLKKK